MIESILNFYDYYFIVILMLIGLYGMIIKKNLVKKVIGMSIFQSAIILFFISRSAKHGATVPIMAEKFKNSDLTAFINPLPHALMLTAIVVGVATIGVAFALLIVIYKRFNTLDETAITEQMK